MKITSKLRSSLLRLGFASVAVGAITPRPAEASLVAFMLTFGGFTPFVTCGGVISCVLMAPLFVLDGEAGPLQVTAESLRMNGYSDQEIADIAQDQAEMHRLVGADSLKITVEGNRAAFESRLREIKPNLSEAYVGFLAEQAGL